nr:MAG TPA: hypothetical protein [Microviridae sp.]
MLPPQGGPSQLSAKSIRKDYTYHRYGTLNMC